MNIEVEYNPTRMLVEFPMDNEGILLQLFDEGKVVIVIDRRNEDAPKKAPKVIWNGTAAVFIDEYGPPDPFQYERIEEPLKLAFEKFIVEEYKPKTKQEMNEQKPAEVTPAIIPNKETIISQLKQLKSEVEKMHKQTSELDLNPEQDFDKIAELHNDLDQEIQSADSSIDDASKSLVEAAKKSSELEDEISELQKRYESTNEELGQLYVFMERVMKQIQTLIAGYEQFESQEDIDKKNKLAEFWKVWQKWFPNLSYDAKTEDEIYSFIISFTSMDDAAIALRKATIEG